jgi:hypothetical protein
MALLGPGYRRQKRRLEIRLEVDEMQFLCVPATLQRLATCG